MPPTPISHRAAARPCVPIEGTRHPMHPHAPDRGLCALIASKPIHALADLLSGWCRRLHALIQGTATVGFAASTLIALNRSR